MPSFLLDNSITFGPSGPEMIRRPVRGLILLTAHHSAGGRAGDFQRHSCHGVLKNGSHQLNEFRIKLRHGQLPLNRFPQALTHWSQFYG
jgi:hypothetical protein